MDTPVFAIDCDEVLRRTLEKMVELYNEHFDDNKTVDEVKNFKTEISFPRIEAATGMTASQWFFQEHSKELFLDTEPYPNIKEDIETLRKYGKVVILTYQKSYKNKAQTLQWLDNQGIECDGICFLKDKTLLSADYLIDDNDWNFQGSKVKNGILVTAPYNVDKDETELLFKSSMSTITRVSSLHEFVTLYDQAMKSIEQAKKDYNYEYKDKPTKFTLKDSVPYNERGTIRQFSKAGEKVYVASFYMRGVTPFASIQLCDSWPGVGISIDNLNKYVK